MAPIVWVFGLISGAIAALMFLLTAPFMERIGFDRAEVIGYSTLVAASLLIFFGVRSYREKQGGALTFGKGLAVGTLIAVVSALCYMTTWVVLSRTLMQDFPEKYQAHLIEKARAEGKSAEEIEATRQEVARNVAMLKNPLISAGVAFMESFMVGFVFALITAFALRRKAVGGVARPAV